MSTFLNSVSEHFADMASAAKRSARELQKTPIGTVARSGPEQAALWRKLRLLPPEQFNGLLDAAAQKVGHQPGEEQPCPVCKFVVHHAELEGKRK
jgi:hypothetical protein